jgi:hypothetical protein
VGILCYTIWSCLYISSCFLRSWLGFITWCLCFMVGLAYLGAETMRLYAIRVQERNAYEHSLHWFVQYGTNGKCPFFCMDFFVLFVNSSFTLMLICRSTVQSLLCQNNMWQVRQCRCLNHNKRCKKCWVCCVCVCYHEMHLVVWLQKEKTYRPSYHGKDISITIWCTFIRRWKHFSPEWQWHWKWHRWHYWNKLHTVDYQ